MSTAVASSVGPDSEGSKEKQTFRPSLDIGSVRWGKLFGGALIGGLLGGFVSLASQAFRLEKEDTVLLDPPSPYLEKCCYDVAQKFHLFLTQYKAMCRDAYKARYLKKIRKAIRHCEYFAVILYQLVNREMPREWYSYIQAKQHYDVAMRAVESARLECFTDDQQDIMKKAEISIGKTLSMHLSNIYVMIK